MKTSKNIKLDKHSDRETEKVISKFSQKLMSNSKWVRLVDKLVENADKIFKIEFKQVHKEQIGEIYIDEKMEFEFDYWYNGFEGCNSFGGWLTFKEIEYIIFPRVVDSSKQIFQDLKSIETLISSVGEFDIEKDSNNIKLNCYR